jgi:hypothetical protein
MIILVPAEFRKCNQNTWSSLGGAGFFALVAGDFLLAGPGFFALAFFEALVGAALIILDAPDKDATAYSASIIDRIPVRASSSPDLSSALLSTERAAGLFCSTPGCSPTTVSPFALDSSDSSEGGVAVDAAPLMLLTVALALAEDFWGRGVFRILAIVVDSSVAFQLFSMSNFELTRMI